MMGTCTPCLSSCSTMCGTPLAASSLFTVTRTSSDPARASAATCCTVEGMSAVSVLVIDCTTIGASEPTRTPPTTAVTVFLRWVVAIAGINSLPRKLRPLPLCRRCDEGYVQHVRLGLSSVPHGYRFRRWLRHRPNLPGTAYRRLRSGPQPIDDILCIAPDPDQ